MITHIQQKTAMILENMKQTSNPQVGRKEKFYLLQKKKKLLEEA